VSVLIQFKQYIVIYVDISFSYFVVGSKYKFRVMAASASGISEPSQESEEIMIGKISYIKIDYNGIQHSVLRDI
jgi:hypothetical protein